MIDSRLKNYNNIVKLLNNTFSEKEIYSVTDEYLASKNISLDYIINYLNRTYYFNNLKIWHKYNQEHKLKLQITGNKIKIIDENCLSVSYSN